MVVDRWSYSPFERTREAYVEAEPHLPLHVPSPSVSRSSGFGVGETRQRPNPDLLAAILTTCGTPFSLSYGAAPTRCQLSTFVEDLRKLFENGG